MGKRTAEIVGFEPKQEQGAQFLIFPKSLKRFEGARVVGIKFDLVEQPKLEKPRDRPSRPPPVRKPRSQPKPVESKPKPAESKSKPAESKPKPAEKAPPPEQTKSTAADPEVVVPFEPAKPAAKNRPPSATEKALIHAIETAMKDLQRGKAVAAYQKLERALNA